MATERKRFVNIGSTAGGDGTTNGTAGATRAYADWGAAVTAEQANLVSADVFLVIEDITGGAFTTLIDVQNYTTDATRYIELKATGAGASAIFKSRDNTGTGAQVSVAVGTALRLREDFVRVDGIEFKSSDISGQAIIEQTVVGASNDVRLDNILAVTDDAGQTTNMVKLSLANLNATVTNCLMVGVSGRGPDTRDSASVTFDHCGFYGAENLGLTGDSELTTTNSWAMGFTSEDFWTGGAAPSGNNNASADASADDDYTSSLINRTDTTEFESPSTTLATFDFTLKSGNTIGGQGTSSSDIGPEVAAAGPTLTAPATITDGTSSTWTGTNLDSLASTGDVFLRETAIALNDKLQTYGTVTATTVPDVVNDTGQDELRDSGSSPVSGIAVTADIEASGATTAVHLLVVDNQSDPEATFSTVITTESTIQTVQTMIAVAETASGQGLFATNIVTVEDDHQCAIPKIVNSVTITLDATGDGSITVLESELTTAGGSITFDALYYSPSTEQWAKVAVTLTEAGLNVGSVNMLSIGIGLGL